MALLSSTYFPPHTHQLAIQFSSSSFPLNNKTNTVNRWSARTRPTSIRALYVDDDGDYLVDAPESIGDGFSFTGGKYSKEAGRAEEWFARGKMIKAYPIEGGLLKARDPLFGLAMGEASQVSDDTFRWFCVEEGSLEKPTVLLVHGFPSQAYSFRKVLPILSSDFHVVAFDWLGFGFSDKPQPNNGFNYTIEEYATALALLVKSLGLKKMSIVAQGYFSLAAVKFADLNQDKVDRLILINPPVTKKHAKLPSALSAFSSFLLGEIFAQDPLRASDKPLTECGPYLLDEEDAMVYRKPYLTSGAAGFALTAISRALRQELQGSINALREVLLNSQWQNRAFILWGMKDKWLDFGGVEEFKRLAKFQLVQLPEVGHHAQEDFAEEVGAAVKAALRRTLLSSYF